MSVRHFVKTHNIPTNFGVLSLDAEGVTVPLLAAFLAAGVRPRFIVVEWLGSTPKERSEPLEGHGYIFLAGIGLNGC